ncbi:A-kinase anchor protein 10, mitochondrial [Acipenser ruthenus]|uniref:A-kinase anchor protein 10, mitochondrial n=1 Tax=Acipenser ruthenus TaxID=7906 RepID=A0A662YJF4_ACIRT|nr:A-kinase anchor protein 10, mitochondrial [Acipenser ruthenus]
MCFFLFVCLTAPVSVQSPSLGTRNHAIQEAAGPSHVAINAISANMDSFARGRTAILKKQPCHMEAVHFGDLGSMFSQAMKKWVQGNTDEAQEEMAWKIAKMIVNEVMRQAQYEPPCDKSTKVLACSKVFTL